MRALALLVTVTLVGCPEDPAPTEDASGHDEGEDDCASVDGTACTDLNSAWLSFAADNRSCANADDCVLRGGPLGEPCDCVPEPLSERAVQVDAGLLADCFAARARACLDAGELGNSDTCDAVPNFAGCVDGLCVVEEGPGCCGCGEDGGVP